MSQRRGQLDREARCPPAARRCQCQKGCSLGVGVTITVRKWRSAKAPPGASEPVSWQDEALPTPLVLPPTSGLLPATIHFKG